jgi:hypothetical protein
VPIAAILVFYSITSSRRLIHHFIPFALWYGRKRAKVDPGSGGFSDRVECCDAFSAESRRRAAWLFVGQKRFGPRRHSCSKELLQISIDGPAAAARGGRRFHRICHRHLISSNFHQLVQE